MLTNKEKKANDILKILEKLYPKTPIPLSHKDPYTLLVAVVLSAQCTDERVNKITPLLFKEANNPKNMVKLGVRNIEKIIRPCGLSPQKSKSIHTLSVVMSQAFGYPAFPVDTHIHRLAWRWGLSTGKNVEQTEKDLKRLFPIDKWNKLHLQIIFYGREFCPARGHDLEKCIICFKHRRKNNFK